MTESRPRVGIRPGRSAAVLASALAVAVVAILVFVSPTPGPGVVPSRATGSGQAGPGSVAAPTVTPTAPALLDADGAPLTINGERVLRGSAIVDRANSGDPAAFLAAGWSTPDPEPTCAPSPVHCGYTSLVDAPGAHSTGKITLDTPGGQSFRFGYGNAWAGGFYVLWVRAACAYWTSTCLVVDAEVPPPGAAPSDPSGYDKEASRRRLMASPSTAEARSPSAWRPVHS